MVGADAGSLLSCGGLGVLGSGYDDHFDLVGFGDVLLGLLGSCSISFGLGFPAAALSAGGQRVVIEDEPTVTGWARAAELSD